MSKFVCCGDALLMIATLAASSLFFNSCARAAETAEIKIGLVNPATGPFSVLGKYARKGIDLALAEAKKNAALRDIAFTVIERELGRKAG